MTRYSSERHLFLWQPEFEAGKKTDTSYLFLLFVHKIMAKF